MPIPINVPRLGWNMEQGVFIGWLKAEGDAVRAGEPLFTLEGEKATEDVEGVDTGVLHIPPDAPKKGDVVAVGAAIGFLLQNGEPVPDRKPVNHVAAIAAPSEKPAPAAAVSTPQRRTTSSPRARRVAAELGIDCANVPGTGRTGRIRERDVRAAASSATPLAAGAATAVSPIRRVIAERMLTSHRSTAPVTLTTTLDATNFVNLRNQFKSSPQAAGVPAFTDLLAKLVACALQKHPLLNSRWEDDTIVSSTSIHIGIAVDTDAGLMVPVLRNAAKLDLITLSSRSRDLIERARERKLSADDLQGGTFTITSLGSLGVDAFTPIINFPECAILGVGRIQKRPVVFENQIVARDQLTLSLTFDHRIVDGAPAAKFLQTLTGLIENPAAALLS